jgi:RNA recognition motif-containing protein
VSHAAQRALAQNSLTVMQPLIYTAAQVVNLRLCPSLSPALTATSRPATVTSLILQEDFMTRLYVGNLPFSADEESVRALFAVYGTVQTLSLVNDREIGTPRGFGFIEMSTADAARAMQGLDGKDYDGRPMKVNEAGGRGGNVHSLR